MKTQFNWLKLFGAFSVVAAMALAQAAFAQVSATLDPASITLGDSAQLTLTINGNNSTQPELPAVNGLEFTPAGQSSSFQSINGAVTASVSLMYQVTADHAGMFTIPSISLPGGGSSEPLTLQVLSSAGGAAAPLASLPPPNVPPSAGGITAAANTQPAFLRIAMPKQELYVGELAPVQVKAYFRAGMAASLNGLPVLSSDAFTLNKLGDKPDQSQEIVGGHPYTVVTWSSALTAVKAGAYALDLELPVTVQVQDRSRGHGNPFKQFFGNSPFGSSAFDDSAFDDFFGGTVEKQLTLRTDGDDITVLPLPTTGRPPDFSGAVGAFDVSSEATPTRLTAGDPITLRLKVSGEGDFDRVYSRGLAASPEWKTYPSSVNFDPADNVGYAGTKTFAQAIVPLNSGKENIPAVTFSYFDPDARQYVTRKTTPIPIEVVPGNGPSSVAALPAGSSISGQSLTANPSAPGLAPNQVEAGNFVSNLRPVLFAPWFMAAQGVPVLALFAGLLLHRRRQRLAHDPELARHRAAQAAIREQLAAMDQALAANSAPAFFTAARQVVQEKLARCWHLSASEVTAAEINQRLNGNAGDLRTLFTVADDVVYSGRRLPSAELRHWKDTVLQQLKQLEEL
jgi:hypothetical protein